MRPYGIKVYLSVNFSSPKILDGLSGSDPLDPGVQRWWRNKIGEIYRLIPDFGGFLVKANSEGQPGPHDYSRSHADGANMLADALKPHGGIVMWRAFVYNPTPEDRAKQAYQEFIPLDGKFRDNCDCTGKEWAYRFSAARAIQSVVRRNETYGADARTTDHAGIPWILQSSGVPGTAMERILRKRHVLQRQRFYRGENNRRNIILPSGKRHRRGSQYRTGYQLVRTSFCASELVRVRPAGMDHGLTADEIADEWLRMTFTGTRLSLLP